MSPLGLGRVKTPTFNLRVEIPSRFRKFENQKCLRPLRILGSRTFSHNLGQKRKWRRFQVMSALPHKADIDARDCDVRFVPSSDSRTAAKRILLDHLGGAGEHGGGMVKPRFGIDIDHQLQFGQMPH